jgi:hypothetical protein
MECLSFIPETASVMGITAARDRGHLVERFSAKRFAGMACGKEGCSNSIRAVLQNVSLKTRLLFSRSQSSVFLSVLCDPLANSVVKIFKSDCKNSLKRSAHQDEIVEKKTGKYVKE